MERLLKFNYTILFIVLVLLFYSSCNKKAEQESISFQKMSYFISEQNYFSVDQGIYRDEKIYFVGMKIVLGSISARIYRGEVNLNNLLVYPEPPLSFYSSDLIISIKRDPTINLKRMTIEGYDAEIISVKDGNKRNKARKIEIDIKNNIVYTFDNSGVWK